MTKLAIITIAVLAYTSAYAGWYKNCTVVVINGKMCQVCCNSWGLCQTTCN